MLQPHDLGWIAGTLDLKGHLIIKENAQRATPQAVLLIESKEISVIKRLSDYTGTDPETKQNPIPKVAWQRRGCVDHCPTDHIHVPDVRMPLVSRWQVTGSSMVVVLYNVLPYLTDSLKSVRFREGMELVSSRIPLSGQGRSAIDKAIRRLAGLGWLIPPYLFRDDEDDEDDEKDGN